MIKYFAAENFASIKEQAIVEFDLNVTPERFHPAHAVVGFAGANASGKTTVLKALSFTLFFMKWSFTFLAPEEDIPYQAFIEPKQAKNATKLHLIFQQVVDGEAVNFEYILLLNHNVVLSEKLSILNQDEQERLIYQRTENKITFGAEQDSIPIEGLRENCSIVSYAAQFKQKFALACVHYESISNLSRAGLKKGEFEFNQAFLTNVLADRDLCEQLKTVIHIADLGIKDVQIKKNALGVKELKFLHALEQGVFPFSLELESEGTLKFIAVILKVLMALQQGAVVIIDEVELKLHQNLVAYLIGLFQNPAKNPHQAQLIFSFHNSFLMEILMPEQLWFTEKSAQGKTSVFCAVDFGDSIQNLYEKDLELLYRAGRFGAKPREL